MIGRTGQQSSLLLREGVVTSYWENYFRLAHHLPGRSAEGHALHYSFSKPTGEDVLI